MLLANILGTTVPQQADMLAKFTSNLQTKLYPYMFSRRGCRMESLLKLEPCFLRTVEIDFCMGSPTVPKQFENKTYWHTQSQINQYDDNI